MSLLVILNFIVFLVTSVELTNINMITEIPGRFYKISNLKLRDINNSLLGDLYPITFQVKFQVENYTISILFSRIFSSKEFQISKAFRGVSIKINNCDQTNSSESRSVLYLNTDSHKTFRKYGLKLTRSLFVVKNQSLEVLYGFDLSLRVYEKFVIRVCLDLSNNEYVAHLSSYFLKKQILAGNDLIM